MSDDFQVDAPRSYVKIDTTAKAMAQPRVAAYDGVTEEEMQRLMDLAVKAYETTIARLRVQARR